MTLSAIRYDTYLIPDRSYDENKLDRDVAQIKTDISINFLFMTSYLPEKHFHFQQHHGQDEGNPVVQRSKGQ